MFKRILIANRGEIACRVIRTAHKMGVETVAVYSDADANALHVKQATLGVHIGESAAQSSYLDGEKIIQAALDTAAEAIHPGYGFLSENPDFVNKVVAAGLVFIGPSSDAINAMGLKDAAKQRVADAGVPVVPGYHGSNQEAKYLRTEADKIGYPLLIKARAGGGGKGMRLVSAAGEFQAMLDSAVREAVASFNDGAVLLEKFIESPRHIEVQVFGDSRGQVVHLFERDCTLQRRHQKVIEEAPAPGMSDEVRQAMTQAAITAAKSIGYTNAGTIEFIVDGKGPLRTDGFWFMEMNTRLQVEHPVTEAVVGVDLVEWQLLVAAGDPIPLTQQELTLNGHSMEARLYAEDPSAGFLPVSGTLHKVAFDEQSRIDTGVQSGDTITPFYDPMIAKITVHGANREQAHRAMTRALENTHIAGTETNLSFLSSLIQHPDFVNATMNTGLIDEHIDDLLPTHEPSELDRLLACLAIMQPQNLGENPGWRLWGSASKRVKLSVNDEISVHRIEFDQDSAYNNAVRFFLDENDENAQLSISLSEITSSTMSIIENGQTLDTHYAVWESAQNGDLHAWVKRGQSTRTFVSPNPLTSSGGAAAPSDQIVAPMTGVIRVVHKQIGDVVNEGEPLIVLEAMKMETTLVAPRDGKIESQHCAPEDAVNDGDVLIKLEESESSEG